MATIPVTPTPFASASLYVGDLLGDVTEALLFEVFNAVGPVASVRVCRDAATRRSLGYAYVNFHRVDDAERALDTMNFRGIGKTQKPCRIMWSHRDPSLRKSGLGNIFVKNLEKSIDNKTLFDTFSIFGNILSCKVATSRETGESLGYGFVHYESEEAARKAIEKVNGKVLGERGNRPVSVEKFRSKKERGGTSKDFTNLYVKNIPKDWTQQQFEEKFAAFGAITSSRLMVDEKNNSRGFGFVNFANHPEAVAAIEAMNGLEVTPAAPKKEEKEQEAEEPKDKPEEEGDKKEEDKEAEDKEEPAKEEAAPLPLPLPQRLYVARAQKKSERQKDLQERFAKLRLEKQKKWAGVNLYIKNLADEIDDDRLRQEFTKFGSITSSRVMCAEGGKGKSKGFGFVCFSTQEEATRAVTDMNGTIVEGKPLFVALAQPKEERRARLEAIRRSRGGMKAGMGGPMYPPQGPMFPQPRGMMFPPQGVPVGWPAQPMMMQPGRFPMVAPNMPNQRNPRRGGGRGQRRQQPQPQQPAAQAPPAGAPAGANYQYKENVRNPPQPEEANAPAAAAPTPAASEQSEFMKKLVSASEEERNQMIGERLFPLIEEQQPEEAGKVTGMLLEMDNGELIHLLESKPALSAKVDEALAVLRQHEEDGVA